jgi:hypothetical protein
MKRILAVFIGIVIIGGIGAAWYFSQNNSASMANVFKSTNTPESPSSMSSISCYEYKQVATKDAPYQVKERLTLTIGNEVVTGTKTGFQSGPDMTNGYEGTITGSRSSDTITAVFTYTVEGSTNNEQEEYQITPTGLIKHRYPLKDENGILVPDTTQLKKDLAYTRISCAE